MIGWRKLRQLGHAALYVLVVSLIITPGGAVAAAEDAWAALVNGGHVVMIRHGNAPPGYGDPPGFRMSDCATQRNSGTWMNSGANKPERLAGPSASMACASTASYRRPYADAWKPPA